MTIEPPRPGEPRRPLGPRDPGDAWVVAPSGQRYWGRFGAAGLLVHDPRRGVLLQHRVEWSHFGGTWGIPGGALHQGERALAGALREAREEAGVPDASVRPTFTDVLDLDVWSYTTVVGEVAFAFEPVISDRESLELEWVPVAEISARPLHPGFEGAWPRLRKLLGIRPVLVVDAANVVGSVPDGWWKDRAGAATRLRDRLVTLRDAGVPARDLELQAARCFPVIVMVVEGRAREVSDIPGVEIVRAAGVGDDAIVAATGDHADRGASVTVVTSDRGLRGRVEAIGASVQGASWLSGMLPAD